MNQQVKTGLGTAILIIIAITVGTFVWIYERDESVEINVQGVKANPIKKQEAPKVFDKAVLESAVMEAVNTATKNIWDKKIEVSAIDHSQKAAKGFWWAQDKWGWIAWQKEDGSWNVEVDRDGFDCNGIKNIPAVYEGFFKDMLNQKGQAACYNWKDKISENLIYRNEKYGFEITLPKGWEGYKVIVKKDDSIGGVTYVYVDLPTSDKNWSGDLDPNTGKSLMGYASMFAISVWDINSWNKHVTDCERQLTPDCGGADLGKGNGYVYQMSMPQAMPEDLLNLINLTKDAKNIQESFKVI